MYCHHIHHSLLHTTESVPLYGILTYVMYILMHTSKVISICYIRTYACMYVCTYVRMYMHI